MKGAAGRFFCPRIWFICRLKDEYLTTESHPIFLKPFRIFCICRNFPGSHVQTCRAEDGSRAFFFSELKKDQTIYICNCLYVIRSFSILTTRVIKCQTKHERMHFEYSKHDILDILKCSEGHTCVHTVSPGVSIHQSTTGQTDTHHRLTHSHLGAV